MRSVLDSPKIKAASIVARTGFGRVQVCRWCSEGPTSSCADPFVTPFTPKTRPQSKTHRSTTTSWRSPRLVRFAKSVPEASALPSRRVRLLRASLSHPRPLDPPSIPAHHVQCAKVHPVLQGHGRTWQALQEALSLTMMRLRTVRTRSTGRRSSGGGEGGEG